MKTQNDELDNEIDIILQTFLDMGILINIARKLALVYIEFHKPEHGKYKDGEK